MAHTFKQALTDAVTKAPQHAAYLHALIHAANVDAEPADQVEWTHEPDCSPETCDDAQRPKPALPL